MVTESRVELAFQHSTPRYIATGVDPNDLERIISRIHRWSDWCNVWSDEAQRHEDLAREAAEKGRTVTAAEAWLRASIYYHYGKHLFGAYPTEYVSAHKNMLRCYAAAAAGIDPTMEHIKIPFGDHTLYGYVRKPAAVVKPPIAVILPGLDAAKEELHSWSDAFLRRGLATLTLDGPGQGECIEALPITPEWGKVLGAVIDELERRSDIDAKRVGVVGQSLGALYAPLSAAGEPRIRACVANCGPFNFGPVLPQMPEVSQELFQIRAHLPTREDALRFAYELSLENVAERIACPLLIVFGCGDRVIPMSEGKRLTASVRCSVDFVLYEEGNHVCFNIPYKFRPLTADWMREHL
jgi:dienelactone hydrolase